VQKQTVLWKVSDLAARFSSINFPEYQREPNVWSRGAKQRLIDSIARQFDIASIYLYIDGDGSIDCIDGRQRIGAIMSFLGKNPEDEDNDFEYRVLNEIFQDKDHPYGELEGIRFGELEGANPVARAFIVAINTYPLNIVQLSGSRQPEEFNLQFTRLNLGTIINSGEKLHAMVGELRNLCFEQGLGQHAFFETTSLPTRRFSKEQVAAQLVTQVLSREKTGEYTRTRHFDLQRAFKEYARLSTSDKAIVAKATKILDRLEAAFSEVNALRNRAITVSTVLLAWEEGVSTSKAAAEIARFIDGFTCRLQWQVRKGLDVDSEYRYLIDFQRHLTQASVEKRAVSERARVLREELGRWKDVGEYRGDAEYRKRTGSDPGEACRGGV
jgi:hypothetical protein